MQKKFFVFLFLFSIWGCTNGGGSGDSDPQPPANETPKDLGDQDTDSGDVAAGNTDSGRGGPTSTPIPVETVSFSVTNFALKPLELNTLYETVEATAEKPTEAGQRLAINFRFQTGLHSQFRIMNAVTNVKCPNNKNDVQMAVYKADFPEQVRVYGPVNLSAVQVDTQTDYILSLSTLSAGCESFEVQFVSWLGSGDNDPDVATICSGPEQEAFLVHFLYRQPVKLYRVEGPSLLDSESLCGKPLTGQTTSRCETSPEDGQFFCSVETDTSLLQLSLQYDTEDTGKIVCRENSETFFEGELNSCETKVIDFREFEQN